MWQLLHCFGIPPKQASSLLTQLVLNLSGLVAGTDGAWSVSEPNMLTSFP